VSKTLDPDAAETELRRLLDEAERAGAGIPERLPQDDRWRFHRADLENTLAHVRSIRGWLDDSDGPRPGSLGLTRPLGELSGWPPELNADVDAFLEALGRAEAFWRRNRTALTRAS
jgi:hypothetical protein